MRVDNLVYLSLLYLYRIKRRLKLQPILHPLLLYLCYGLLIIDLFTLTPVSLTINIALIHHKNISNVSMMPKSF